MRFMLRSLVGVLLVLFAVQVSAAQSEQTATKTFTLAPGAKATVTYQGFCVDFGKKFPTTLSAPSGVVSDQLQSTLYYALTKDYVTSDPLQVQAAIWNVNENQSIPESAAVAEEIQQQFASVTLPAMQGTSVLDAVQAGDVKLTMGDWHSVGDQVTIGTVTDYYHGQGQLTLENTSQKSLQLYMPIGTLFSSSDTEVQNITSYASNIEVSTPTLPETSALHEAPLLGLALLAGMLLVLSRIVRRSLRV